MTKVLLCTNNLWEANSNQGGTRGPLEDIHHGLNTLLCLTVTGVLWSRWKSLHPAACRSPQWARPPPAGRPLPAARPTFSLLRRQHPRAWSTLQVRGAGAEHVCTSVCFFRHVFFHVWWVCINAGRLWHWWATINNSEAGWNKLNEQRDSPMWTSWKFRNFQA